MFSSLLSHGPGSSLIAHSREVMEAADEPWEQIILICHDVGKATEAWQKYAKNGFTGRSPHGHAVFGGALSAALFLSLEEPEYDKALIALHVVSAHHNVLRSISLTINKESILSIYHSEQAKQFAKELLNIDSLNHFALRLAQGWQLIPSIFAVDDKWGDLSSFANDLTNKEKAALIYRARSLLGRLTRFDRASAEAQVSGTRFCRPIDKVQNFKVRATPFYPDNQSELSRLRAKLTQACSQVSSNARFFTVCAPTGMGKTEAMLRLAEKLISDKKLSKIIYAVPYNSVGEQVFYDYLSSSDSQIWNSLIRIQSDQIDSRNEVHNLFEVGCRLTAAERPFGSSYNVTTFNQVFFALAHPHRVRCGLLEDLQQSVIILDEFHKIPLLLLSPALELFQAAVTKLNSYLILGSASPLPVTSLIEQSMLSQVTLELEQEMFAAPCVQNRRIYEKASNMDIQATKQWIDEFHNLSSKSLLVILNLVAQGTYQLLKAYNISIDPWQRLKDAKEQPEPAILVLDGTVPPLLRRDYISFAKGHLADRRPITLISTQMIEVGVDLDFDVGLIDYQCIASTLQRAGRVGRNGGRLDVCKAYVFSLLTETGTSEATLNGLLENNDTRLTLSYFEKVYRRFLQWRSDQLNYIKCWPVGGQRTEQELMSFFTGSMPEVINEISKIPFSTLFQETSCNQGSFGLTLEHLEVIADIFGTEEDGRKDFYLFEDQDTLNDSSILLNDPKRTTEVLRLLERRKISLFSSEIIAAIKAVMDEVAIPGLDVVCFCARNLSGSFSYDQGSAYDN